MGTSFLNQWFSDGAIKAICWTLIHSLWIGLIISLLAALVIMFTRKSAAALRYRLLCGILVLFILSVAVVFCIQVRSNGAGQINPGNQKFFVGDGNVKFEITNQHFPAHSFSAIEVIVNFLDSYVNIIFLAWLLLFVMKSLKMMGGLLYIQRLRNYRVHEVSEEFKHKIELFSRQIGIRQSIRLMQSELVKVPVVVGWLKPLILLPIGIITQLPAEQLDSILWHEMAHIRRRDYLVNILQAVVEAVFFFNPGLLWLSSLIRAEREACCDDLVIARMNKKANYLEALLSFGFGEFQDTGLAMGIGSGNHLRDRLKRIITQENKRLSIAEKAVLGFGLMLLTVFTAIPKAGQAAVHFSNDLAKKVASVIDKRSGTKTVTVALLYKIKTGATLSGHTGQEAQVQPSDTGMHFKSVLFNSTDVDFANSDFSAMDKKGNKYHFVLSHDKLVLMEMNGVKIADDKLQSYTYLIDYIRQEMLEKRRVRMTDLARVKSISPRAKFKKDDSVLYLMRTIDSLKVAARQSRDDGESGRSMADAQRRLNKLQNMRIHAHADSVNYAQQLQRMRIQTRADGIAYEQQLQNMRIRSHVDSIDHAQQLQRMRIQTQADGINYKQQLQNMRIRARVDSMNFTQELQKMRSIIIDLVNEKVVSKPSDVKWFGLSDTELLVNGIKQRDALQQRLKAKYGVREGNGLYYGPVKMTGRGVFIDEEAVAHFKRDDSLRRRSMEPRPMGDGYEPRAIGDSLAVERRLVQLKHMAAMDAHSRMQSDRKFDTAWKKRWSPAQDSLMKLRKFEQFKVRDGYVPPRVSLQPIITNIIADLVTDNVVKDKNDVSSFNLTNTYLMVNGVKQSAKLHNKLKSKYLEGGQYEADRQIVNDPKFGFHYNGPGSMGIGITNDRADTGN
jgi:bla regulator protein BlaR1